MLAGMEAHAGEHRPVLLRLEGLWVAFGPLLAVQDVGFELRAGDLLGLVGPNGAGKTTLLRAIVGLQPTVGGRVAVMEEVVTEHSREHLRVIGFTPDTPGMYASLTVRDFLAFVARGYGLHPSMWDEVIEFWLEKVWLKDKARQKVRTLSRGMKATAGDCADAAAESARGAAGRTGGGAGPGGAGAVPGAADEPAGAGEGVDRIEPYIGGHGGILLAHRDHVERADGELRNGAGGGARV